MRKSSVMLAALSLLLTSHSVSAQITVDRSANHRSMRRDLRAPDVAVWIDRFSYRPGQRIRPFFQSDDGAFVTIIRVSTTGDLTVLYPRRPSQQVAYRTGALRDDEVPYWSDLPFFVNEAEGVGFVVAIASYEPFDYRRVSRRDLWDTWQLSSGAYRTTYGLNSYPDPYELVGSFIDRALPANAEYSTDYIQYQVVQDYLYQRRNAGYSNLYYRCLQTYTVHAEYYCSQYASYGYALYVPVFITRYPAPTPVGTPATPTPTGKRPKLRERIIGDPVLTGPGVESGTKSAQRTPTSAEIARADAQRAWWNTQRKEAARNGSGVPIDRGLRVDPQAPNVPDVYRGSPARPRMDAPSAPRPEPTTETRYEPTRVEPVYRSEPRHEPAPVMRSEPPQGNYERPVQAAPPQVIRMEPSVPREIHPAPPPPPPPPPPQSAPHTAPAPQERPIIPPSPPATQRDQ